MGLLANDWVGGSRRRGSFHWSTLALATLRTAGNTISWDAVQGADSYDLIRGSVSTSLFRRDADEFVSDA